MSRIASKIGPSLGEMTKVVPKYGIKELVVLGKFGVYCPQIPRAKKLIVL
jgi:hypothetical protein